MIILKNSNGPWGKRGPSSSNNNKDFNTQFDDLSKMFKKGGGMFGNMGPKISFLPLLLLAVAMWLGSGFYKVLPDEQGIVLRFGKYVRKTDPGLNYHLPYPIESVLKPKVTAVNTVEIGRGGEITASGNYGDEQAYMLTGDENIGNIIFSVQWVIKDAVNFLFNVRSPKQTIYLAADSAMREIIGQTPIVQAFAEGRGRIEAQTLALLQKILDEYKIGVEVRGVQLLKADPPAPVIDAFLDVQRAKADLEKMRNRAEKYRNEIIPKARGTAEKIKQDAEASKKAMITRAEGEAERFRLVLSQYKHAKDVTKKRMLLETMEKILEKSNKVIMTDKNKSGVLPYLPLDKLQPTKK